jgi:hypothetical protein
MCMTGPHAAMLGLLLADIVLINACVHMHALSCMLCVRDHMTIPWGGPVVLM